MSIQTFSILDKIHEVDQLISPKRQAWIHEVHPEVSFWAMRGKRSLKKKKSQEGKKERLKLLLGCYPRMERHLVKLDKRKAAEDDLLDAAAAAWTAERIARGEAASVHGLGALVPVDSKNLRMDIVY